MHLYYQIHLSEKYLGLGTNISEFPMEARDYDPSVSFHRECNVDSNS